MSDLSLFVRLTRLSVLQKQAIFATIDIATALLTLWIAFSLRFSTVFVFFDWRQVTIFALSAILVPPIFIRCGLYRAVFRYSSFGAATAVARAVAFYGLAFGSCVLVLSFSNVPRTVAVIQPVLFAWGVLAVRSFGFLLLPRQARLDKDQNVERVLIYGAGVSGIQTLSALRFGRTTDVVGFVDDDPSKIGREVFGVRVFSRAQAEAQLRSERVDGVLLAVPNVSRARRNAIIDWLHPFNAHVRSVPSVDELAAGDVVLALRELDVEDLLGREPIAPGGASVERDIAGRVILVTGAGGSIGSELCRQIVSLRPTKLLLVDISEYALYAINRDLEGLCKHAGIKTRLIPLLGNIRDEKRMSQILAAWQPRAVYHAAAYKHVPLVEHNPFEGVSNNVLGTLTLAQAARTAGVGRFVLISTDKAVRPTNIMGATKRMAEIVLQALAADNDCSKDQDGTVFTMVRFGNVLGSSGSVVPLFRNQIAAGIPVTVTHPDITRYFMSIPEAAQLVLRAGAMARGGEVFLLDMGEPVKIVDLARKMIELSGARVRDDHCPDGDIEIVFTGLRPGEKLYEELLIGEHDVPTSHERIIEARERMWEWSEVEQAIATIRSAIDNSDLAALRVIFSYFVDGFVVDGPSVDHIYLENLENTSGLKITDL